MGVELLEVPLEKLLAPEREMRETMTHEGMEELIDSIRRIGLRQPLNVRRKGELFEVVAGARRLEACRALGYSPVPCVLAEGDERALEEIKIHENLKREDVDPVEEARYYRRLVDEKGWSLDDLIKATGRAARYLEDRLEITKWDEDIQGAVSAKAITLAVARELMRFQDKEARARYLQAAANSGVSARTMESWRLQYEASLVPAPSADGGGGDGTRPSAVEPIKTWCACCGEDLSGMVQHWVPVSQRCLDWLKGMQARAMQGPGATVPAGGAEPA